jgi:6-pyruvoyl-tetrahydropterin synthase
MKPSDDLVNILSKLFNQYQKLIAFLIFLIGIGLRLYSLNQASEIWNFVGEIGTFLAASIAIPFIYERFIKSVERQLYLNELERVLTSLLDARVASAQQSIIQSLEHRLLNLSLSGTKGPTLRETGRFSLEDKKIFLEDAKHEVIHVAISASTFSNYFTQRSYYDFRKFIEDLLEKGVTFKLLFLDPHSDLAKTYADDRGEPGLIEKIHESINVFKILRDEFDQADYSGKFELFTYSHFPYYYALVIDPQQKQGKMSVSNYLYGLKRADNPVVNIYRYSNPILFDAYWKSISSLLKESKRA